ncbi:MAG: permease-like cell division protein FtsX [bacterium]|nr:permease-like cell division protein FtsX [bacterium]
MMLGKASYFTVKALDSIKGNPFVNIITIGVIAVSFIILGGFIALFGNLKSLLADWEQRVQIEAYLKGGLPDSQIKELQNLISSLEGVGEVSYIGKDDAIRKFADEMPAIAGLVDDLDENPLPSSIRINLDEGHREFIKVEALALRLGKMPGIDDVFYGQEWLEKFSGFISMLKLSGLILGLFLLLTTTFIISNTIRLALYARKEELEVMKLLGATNFFMKTPFLIEGLLQGLVGAAASLVSLYALYSFFVAKLASKSSLSVVSLSSGSFQPAFLSLETIFYLLICGMALGLFGSFVSLGRFLKV